MYETIEKIGNMFWPADEYFKRYGLLRSCYWCIFLYEDAYRDKCTFSFDMSFMAGHDMYMDIRGLLDTVMLDI